MRCKSALYSMMICSLLLPSFTFAASAVGKVRSAVGAVERQKEKSPDWKQLRVSERVFQTDRVRTGVESEVILGFPDGSSISVAENSEILLSNLLEEDGKGAFKTKIEVQKGHVNFAVQKLQNENSSFIFKTGTATAAIRGTKGFVGGGDVFFAALSTGKLDINLGGDSTKVSAIAGGETIVGVDSLVTLKLASSGDAKFASMIEKILATGVKDINSIVAQVVAADSMFQEEKKQSKLSELPENGFVINTSSPVNVCNDGLSIDGFYSTNDSTATLTLSVGKNYTSENLIHQFDGQPHAFAQKIMVSDVNGLWTEKLATLTFKSKSVSDVKTLDLNISKTCAGVNQISPEVKFLSYDSIACKMSVSVLNLQNDAGILSVAVDGSTSSEESLVRNEQRRVPLISGVHEYSFEMKDMAGNVGSLKKTLGCYPVKRFNIEVFGNKKESLSIPPPPKGMDDRITQTLQFKIRNPENDPLYLYKVTIKQNGKVILQESLAQIQSLDYQLPVELTRNGQNRFDIEVVHKSGFTAKAQKIYEVH